MWKAAGKISQVTFAPHSVNTLSTPITHRQQVVKSGEVVFLQIFSEHVTFKFSEYTVFLRH